MTATDGRIVVWGTGEEGRDLLYVDDLVAFMVLAIERQKAAFEIYNCGAGSAVTVKELVRMIVGVTGRDLRTEHDLTRPTIVNRIVLDCGKAERELGWKPQVALDEGIRRTVVWWRDHIGPKLPNAGQRT
jgi:nucleoside-diphosphate-sugar epimerase